MFKHRPFVNFVKYFLPRWRRTREPRRNAVYFSKQHFYFSSTRKRKGCRVMKDEKKGGRGEGKGVYTRRVDVYSRVVDTKKNVANEKKKENIYCRGCVLTLCIYIFIHTHTHTLLRLFRDTCSMWLF